MSFFCPNVSERQRKFLERRVTFMADLDRLEVQVEASAAKANAELNKLVNKLEKVAASLSGINSSGLVGFANGIEKLGKSMQTMNSVKTSDFTRLAKNIQKLSMLNTAGLNTASSAFLLFGKSLTNFGAAAKSAESIAVMAKNISKLGGKNVQNAIESMPRLAAALRELLTTLSQAPNVSRNVIQMTRALADLSNALRGAQNGGAGNGGNNSGAGNINKLSLAFSRLTGSITKSKISMKSFAREAGKFYVNCFLIIRAIKRLGQAINTSMDYVETYNYFAVTMDKIGKEFSGMYAQYGYDSAEAYAESFTDRMNALTQKMTGYKVGNNGELTLTDSIGLALDPEAVMNYQSSLAAVTNSVGLIGENSVNVSKALTMLSADMSSLKNVDLKTVMTNFQSGLIGQSRALYKYGIDITNATLRTYAYNFGLSKAVSEMTQAEKMQLRILAILDQSRAAWGDQANTINSVANQYRIMKQQLSNLARTIGNLFLPIVRKVLPVINGLIIALQRLFTTLGFKLWGGNWLKDNMEGISGGYADDSLGALGDDADDAADSLGNAAKAAEKLKTTVLGIDELNINAPQEESGSGSGAGGAGGSIDLSNAIAGALADYESVWDEAFAKAQNRAQEFADMFTDIFRRIGNGELGQMITNVLNHIDWDFVYESARAFGTGLANFLNSLISPELFGAVGRTVAGSLNTAIYTALSFGTTFDWANYGLSIATGVNDFFKTFDFKALAGTINVWAKGLLDSIITAMSNIEWALIGRQIGTFLAELDFLEIGGKVGRAIWGAISAGIITWENSFSAAPVETAVMTAIAVLGFTDIGKAIATKIASAVTLAFQDTSVISVLEMGIRALFGNKIAENSLALVNPIVQKLTGIGTVFAGLALAASNFFEMWKNGFSWLNEAFMGIGLVAAAVGAVILGVPAGIAAAVAGVVAVIATIAVVLHDNWDAIKGFFTDTIPAWWNGTAIPFLQSIPERFGELVEHIGIFISELPGKIGYWLGETLGRFASWAVETGIYLSEKVPEIIENIRLWFSELPEKVLTEVLLIVDRLAEWSTAMLIFIEENVPEIVNSILDFFIGLPEEFLKIGENIISGLWQGIQGAWSGVKKGIGDFVTNFLDGFEEGFDIHSPSRKMAEIGDYAILGLVEPFNNVGGLEQIRAFTSAMLDLIAQMLSPDKFAVMGQEVLNALLGIFSLEALLPVFGNISLALQTAWTETMTWWQEMAMPMWFEQGILPWFAQEKWTMVTDGMKLGILNKWKELTILWKTNLQKWWTADVMTWFTIVRWSAQGENMRKALTNKWLEFARLWNINITKWWNSDVIVWFTVPGWTAFGENMKNGLYSGFKGIVQMVGSVMNGIIDIFNAGLKQIESAVNALICEFNAAAGELGVSELGKVHAKNIAHVKIPAFAEGGYPNTGELFLARENGINEMVGRIGSRSAVANNDQITDAIRAAVVQGMDTEEQNELLREQNALLRAILEKDTDVTLDGRSLVNGIDETRKRMGWNFQAT